MSLTGDPTTDALIPIAQRLIGAVRDHNPDEVDEAFAAAIDATGGRCDPAAALAVVLAAMVPDYATPRALLGWQAPAAEYRRLVDDGVNPGIAEQLTDYRPHRARKVPT